jgi:hypothetical protein
VEAEGGGGAIEEAGDALEFAEVQSENGASDGQYVNGVCRDSFDLDAISRQALQGSALADD